jgi:hypothetical protein
MVFAYIKWLDKDVYRLGLPTSGNYKLYFYLLRIVANFNVLLCKLFYKLIDVDIKN